MERTWKCKRITTILPREKRRLIQVFLSLFSFTLTLCTYFILYILLFFFVGAAHPALLQRQCECVCAGGWCSGRPSLTPWSLISLLVRVMDDDGQASVCYVSLHTYSKKHFWCPTDSSTHTHTHTHTPSVIQ